MQSFRSGLLFFLIAGMLMPIFAAEAKKKKDKPGERVTHHYLNPATLNGLRSRFEGPALISTSTVVFVARTASPYTNDTATTSGGGWKATNAGVTYQPIFDMESSYLMDYYLTAPKNTNNLSVGAMGKLTIRFAHFTQAGGTVIKLAHPLRAKT